MTAYILGQVALAVLWLTVGFYAGRLERHVNARKPDRVRWLWIAPGTGVMCAAAAVVTTGGGLR